MIGAMQTTRVWAWPHPTDLRKGYDGLYALVRNVLKMDIHGGDCFLFVNRRRTSCKVLLWDGSGLCIYMKRLARGRFPALWRATTHESGALELTQTELALFFEGCKEVGYRKLSPSPVQRRKQAA